jgi:hypothetical protein
MKINPLFLLEVGEDMNTYWFDQKEGKVGTWLDVYGDYPSSWS